MSQELCPTCGSVHKGVRLFNASHDADVPLHTEFKMSQQMSGLHCTVEDGIWYYGSCPDAWHDTERRKGKDRRKNTDQALGNAVTRAIGAWPMTSLRPSRAVLTTAIKAALEEYGI